jgi:hypothetical protein
VPILRDEQGEPMLDLIIPLCTLRRRTDVVGANPSRQLSFQPEVPGADQEVTNGLKQFGKRSLLGVRGLYGPQQKRTRSRPRRVNVSDRDLLPDAWYRRSIRECYAAGADLKCPVPLRRNAPLFYARRAVRGGLCPHVVKRYYHSGLFLCRRFHGLSNASRSEKAVDRAPRGAGKIKQHLGDSPEWGARFPLKPKACISGHMGSSAYRYREAEERVNEALLARRCSREQSALLKAPREHAG